MQWIAAIALGALSADIRAGDIPPPRVNAAIDRGLGFLVKDALAWKKQHNCVSCHHAALVIWSMREAKDHGHAINEQVLRELTEWLAASGDGKTGLARPKSAPQAANPKAIWLVLGLSAPGKPDESFNKGLSLMLQTIQADQIKNGSWSAWPETRPPIFGNSTDSLTALATLALLASDSKGDGKTEAALEKGVQWLSNVKTDDDPQSIAMRLILWTKLKRPSKEWQPLVRRIRQRQNPDGGWSQAPEMHSDAWATGQALYALAHAGLKANDPAIARAHNFLITTQRADGSWPMTSRPTVPGGQGSTSLVPITAAGSAWAVLGLTRSQ
jgi:hypothetical protein